jgi:DNA-binding Lrp family transcriptional regulator
MSGERKYTGMAKLFEIEERRQREKAAEQAPAIISPAATSAPHEIVSPGANISPGEISPPQPVQFAPGEISAPPAILARPEQHTRVPNEIFEDILPTLKTSEQSVLLRLYRLTWGFQKDTCHVSKGKLAKACNLSPRQVVTCLQALEKRRFIRRVHVDLDNKNQSDRGITFQMLLPQAARAKISPPANISPGAKISAGEETAPNKINTQKENTQTQEGVRVGSNFTIEECRRYAEHLRSTGQGINNPGGYATTIHRTGEADALIGDFLNPPPTSASIDSSQCPDCQGSGFYYPSGPSGGVAKCKHERLSREGNNQNLAG